jgi:hypothetical protein
MKDYLSQYLSRRSGSSDKNTKGDELTELTKPDLSKELEGSVSFVSEQPLEYQGIDEDIEWRVQAMLPQIPDNGPLPFLIAREALEPQAGCCLSCGESLGLGDRYRCMPCGRATNLALERAMSSGESSKHNQQ